MGRDTLAVLCLCQFALSLSFLDYIHRNQGARHGDYGISYAAQTARGEMRRSGR